MTRNIEGLSSQPLPMTHCSVTVIESGATMLLTQGHTQNTQMLLLVYDTLHIQYTTHASAGKTWNHSRMHMCI